ncbi:MAG TPA: hypothetical protein VFQ24_11515 [Terriglobia bacterium]|nr:hypothetical protein [Terriglobia bacterium]
MKDHESRALQGEVKSLAERWPRLWGSPGAAAAVLFFTLGMGIAPCLVRAQQGQTKPHVMLDPQVQVEPAIPPRKTHRFFDRTNLALFVGVAAVRALDYTSTQHFRSQGNTEVLLTNSIVDNRPLFAGIEAAGTLASIGVSYWLHRTGHHKLERWISIVHIGVGAVGDAHNYSLGAAH